MTKNRCRLSLHSRVGGTWPAVQASRNALFVRECIHISMATLVCAHGTAILTNHEPSELVEEHIFFALQIRTQNIIRKMIV